MTETTRPTVCLNQLIWTLPRTHTSWKVLPSPYFDLDHHLTPPTPTTTKKVLDLGCIFNHLWLWHSFDLLLSHLTLTFICAPPPKKKCFEFIVYRHPYSTLIFIWPPPPSNRWLWPSFDLPPCFGFGVYLHLWPWPLFHPPPPKKNGFGGYPLAIYCDLDFCFQVN